MVVKLKISKYQFERLLEESRGSLFIGIYDWEEKEIKMLDVLDGYISALGDDKLYKKLKKVRSRLEKTLPEEAKEAKRRFYVRGWEPQKLEVIGIENEEYGKN